MFVIKGRRSREKLRNICPDRRGDVIQGGPDFGHCIQKEAGLGHCVFCATLACPLYTELCTDTVDCIQCAWWWWWPASLIVGN